MINNMLTIIDIVEFLKTKTDVGSGVFAGRIDQKSDCCIGVFDNNKGKTTRRAIGKEENTKFYKAAVTILIHKSGGQNDAMTKAMEIYGVLNHLTDFYISDNHIAFVCPYVPQCIGYTANGTYEYIVETEFYVNKED